MGWIIGSENVQGTETPGWIIGLKFRGHQKLWMNGVSIRKIRSRIGRRHSSGKTRVTVIVGGNHTPIGRGIEVLIIDSFWSDEATRFG